MIFIGSLTWFSGSRVLIYTKPDFVKKVTKEPLS